jgi:rhodanese-related sulfurtransferase
MSQIAAEELVSFGYTNVWNLKGGMIGWKEAGFELEL